MPLREVRLLLTPCPAPRHRGVSSEARSGLEQTTDSFPAVTFLLMGTLSGGGGKDLLREGDLSCWRHSIEFIQVLISWGQTELKGSGAWCECGQGGILGNQTRRMWSLSDGIDTEFMVLLLNWKFYSYLKSEEWLWKMADVYWLSSICQNLEKTLSDGAEFENNIMRLRLCLHRLIGNWCGLSEKSCVYLGV